MVKEKILLTGATGMLGNHIFNLVKELPQFEVYPIGRSDNSLLKNFIVCDISQFAHFEKILNDLRPDVVVHCAANVDVNRCETDRENTFALHVGASALIANREFVRKSIYISTDSVFDGTKGNYVPGDTKNPLNYYAKTKSQGEDEFTKSRQNSIVIRTNIIGFSTPFRSSLFEWGFESLRKGLPIKGFSNAIFNPLYVKTLATSIVSSVLLKEIKSGVYHFGSSDYHSKYDFLKLVATASGFDQSLVHPVELKEINQVRRPLNTTLNIEETQRKLGVKFPTLEQEVLSILGDLNYNTICQENLR